MTWECLSSSVPLFIGRLGVVILSPHTCECYHTVNNLSKIPFSFDFLVCMLSCPTGLSCSTLVNIQAAECRMCPSSYRALCFGTSDWSSKWKLVDDLFPSLLSVLTTFETCLLAHVRDLFCRANITMKRIPSRHNTLALSKTCCTIKYSLRPPVTSYVTSSQHIQDTSLRAAGILNIPEYVVSHAFYHRWLSLYTTQQLSWLASIKPHATSSPTSTTTLSR